MLTDIYAAGEEPIPGVTVEALADADSRAARAGRCTWSRTLDDVVPALLTVVRPGDAVITLGAGSIGTVPKRAASQALEQRGGGA